LEKSYLRERCGILYQRLLAFRKKIGNDDESDDGIGLFDGQIDQIKGLADDSIA
jgi:hypothetical protein